MTDRIELTTPVGRLVQGSLYEPTREDFQGNPLVYKTGAMAGQPRVQYYFALAIRKEKETHWNQTDWGKKIYSVALSGFPNGQTTNPNFSWKITNGDSAIPNANDRRPCDAPGFVGCWILKFTGGFIPNIVNADGSKQIVEKDAVNLGDYIQVFCNITPNGLPQTPGVYLNHSIVAFSAYGERISFKPDATTVGFGKAPLPIGASAVPLSQGFSPEPTPVVSPPAQPYPEILNGPSTNKIWLDSAVTYEQYIAAGWTDAQLIQHGKMKI